MDLLAEFEAINEKFADPEADFDTLIAKQAKLQEKIDAAGAWDLDILEDLFAGFVKLAHPHHGENDFLIAHDFLKP